MKQAVLHDRSDGLKRPYYHRVYSVKLIFVLLCTNLSLAVVAQNDSLIIENKSVQRKFHFAKDSAGFYTTVFLNKVTGENYVNPGTEEFGISINDSLVEGKNCRYRDHHFQQKGDTQTLSITLYTPVPDVFIRLVYDVYQNLPLVRKRLDVINKGQTTIALTNLDVEKLRFQVVNKFDNEVYAGYGTNLHRIPYKGDYNDAAVLLYNAGAKQGAVLGNEAPSVLKNTEIYTQIHGCIQMGMRHSNEPFPFKSWLEPGKVFQSPRMFISVFQSEKWQDGFEYDYKTFVQNYLGVSLFRRNSPPVFIYNTWRPFQDLIDEKTIRACADSLEGTGIDLFIIDVGWFRQAGDFIPDSSKFPGGMKAICDYIRAKGMQPGLWFSVATVNRKSRIATEHPEWLIKDKAGKPANLHNMSEPVDGDGWADAIQTMSLGSPYYGYFKSLVQRYIRELGLAYVKFDLSIAASAYVHDPERTGDFETNSVKLYCDRESSYWIIYERMMQLMDELHREFPHLLIDCTFETWGRYNMVDYALVQHADYDWLTNFEQPPPAGPLSIRQMAYDRARVVPPATLLIGNQSMNSEHYPYVFFSQASSSLLMVGDPRQLPQKQKAFYAKWSRYLKFMDNKYQYTRYFQLYDVFERPADSNWDGCYRINPEKMGGLLFFFRNNSPDRQRTFRIPKLDTTQRYRVYSFGQRKNIGIYSGKFLVEKGLTVTIPKIYSAQVLTLEKL